RVDLRPRVPEVPHVVWMGGPRPGAEELMTWLGGVVIARTEGRPRDHDAPAGPAVELRAPTLVGAVVFPAEIAVHEVELAVEALTVLVLVVGQPQRRRECRTERSCDADATARRVLTALRRVQDGAVRCARAVQRRCVRALQHGDRLDVVRVDVGGRITNVVDTHPR